MMAQKIRECWLNDPAPLDGEVEIDETYIRGLEKNRHMSQCPYRLAGTEGKTPVIGAKQRDGMIVARPMPQRTSRYCAGSLKDTKAPGATMYTEDLPSYPIGS